MKPARRCRRKKENCKLSGWKPSGNPVSWTVSCGGEMPMSLTDTETYAGDRYPGVNKMSANRGGRTMNITQTIDVRRIGGCKQGR